MTDYNELALIFVYKKNKKIKVLSFISAKINHDDLIKKGWEHIASINACIWAEMLLNAKNPIEMINELRQR